jgi:hypothetical protein
MSAARTVQEHAAALRAASMAVFVAHVLKTGFALAVLGGFGLELANVARDGDLIAVASFAMQAAAGHAAAAQWAVCGYLLVGPLLAQFVLAALLRREQPRRAALSRYGRALGLSVLHFSAFSAAIASGFALAFALAELARPELETAARLAPLGLCVLLVAWLSTVHDVAAARLALAGAPRLGHALAHGVRGATPALIATHLTFVLGATLCYAAGEAASRTLWPTLGLALSQALALVSAFIRAGWMSVAIAQTHRLVWAGSNEPADSNQPEMTSP